MIEISLWIPVVFVEVTVFAISAAVFIAYRGATMRATLEAEIERLNEQLAEMETPVELDAPEEVVEEAVAGPPQLVLLSAADVEASTAPGRGGPSSAAESGEGSESGDASESSEAPDSSEAPGAGSGVISELVQKLIERSQSLSNCLNGILERSAELGMKLGAIRGTEGLDDEVKAKIQESIDSMRGSDDALVDGADTSMEMDESLRHLLTLLEDQRPSKVDHVSLNELLMARADGQTEEELEQLREEVRQRLLNPPTAPDPKAAEELEVLGQELSALKDELSREREERDQISCSLSEVTEEYQRLFEQFQPSA